MFFVIFVFVLQQGMFLQSGQTADVVFSSFQKQRPEQPVSACLFANMSFGDQRTTSKIPTIRGARGAPRIVGRSLHLSGDTPGSGRKRENGKRPTLARLSALTPLPPSSPRMPFGASGGAARFAKSFCVAPQCVKGLPTTGRRQAGLDVSASCGVCRLSFQLVLRNCWSR